MSEVSTQTLHVVARELTTELNDARVALELFGEQQDDIEQLRRCREYLRQVRGALRVVEVYGAALLVEEMEQLAQYLIDNFAQKRHLADGLDALMRAMVQLPTYLERVLSGGRDMALVLLPLLNDLRAVRGNALLSEGTLLLLNLSSDKQANPIAPGPGETALPVGHWARRLRTRFQMGLLGWIKGERIEQNLDVLSRTAEKLEQIATTQPVFQLWWVVGAVIEALREHGLQGSASVKRLLGQADREMRRLYETGEANYSEKPPQDLLNNLLYYVGRASSGGPRVTAVRASFRLGELLPVDDQVEAARESLSAPSVKLMKTVAAAIKEDLGRVKDALDIFVRKGGSQPAELVSQLELLRKIGDTLGVLGLGELRERVQTEIVGLQNLLNSGGPADDATLLAMASTLINVEDSLDEQLVGLILPAAGAPAGAADAAASGGDIEFRQVADAVLRECIVNMARIKEAIALAIEKPHEGQALDQIPQLMHGITAGLLMLGKSRAVEITERIGKALARYARNGASVATAAERMDRLADAIVAVEYYMETLQAGRGDPWYMLDNADNCLKALDAMGTGISGLLRVPEFPERPREAETAHDSAVETVVQVDRTEILRAPPTAPKGESADTAQTETGLPPVLLRPTDKSDPEFLELFIEEARDEITKLQTMLPRWDDNPQDNEALTHLRRSFHTLKGSGRLVGAQLIGEFSWSMENMLNRVINKTLERVPDIMALLREAVAELPDLVEQLEIGKKPRMEVASMIARAHALAGGRASPVRVAATHIAAAAVEEPPPPAVAKVEEPPPVEEETAAEPPPQMDPLLHDIFAKEAQGHLSAIRDYIAACGKATAPYPVTEGLHRACHTLSGTTKTAGARQGIKIAEPLNHYIRKLFDNGANLPAEGLSVLQDAVAAIESIIANVNENTAFFPSQASIIERLQRLEHYLDTELSSINVATDSTGIMRMDPMSIGLQPAESPAEHDMPEVPPPSPEAEQAAQRLLEPGATAIMFQPILEPSIESKEESRDDEIVDEEIIEEAWIDLGDLSVPEVEATHEDATPTVIAAFSEPELQAQPEIKVEPEAEHEPIPELTPAPELESVVEPEPAVELEAIADVEPIDEAETIVELEPVVGIEPSADFVQESAPESEFILAEPEPITEPELIPEPTAEFAEIDDDVEEVILLDETGESKNDFIPQLEEAQEEGTQPELIVETAQWAQNFASPVLDEPHPVDAAQAVHAAAVNNEIPVLYEAVPVAPPEPADDVMDDEFDADIAAIFTEEASELLEAADTSLSHWRADRSNAGHAFELKRALHTLKGGARMAGIRAMGDLSHELESFMQSMEAGLIPSNQAVFETLQASLDELHRMRDVLGQGRRVAHAHELVARIRALGRGESPSAAEPPARAVPPAVAEIAAAAEPSPPPSERIAPVEIDLPSEPEETLEAEVAGIEVSVEGETEDETKDEAKGEAKVGADVEGEVEADVEADVEVEFLADELATQAVETPPEHDATNLDLREHVPQPVVSSPAAFAEEPIAATAEPEAAALPEAPIAPPVLPPGREPQPQERGEVARVDADLLDTLLNNAGEVSIFRSRMEQQVNSLDFNLNELDRVVTRLKDQLRKMEIETEAQILHKYQDESKGREDFDPLELDRYSTIQQLSRALAESVSDVASVQGLLQNMTREAQNLLTQQSRIVTELQNGLMRTRMVPFSRHVQRLTRLVRQVATDTGKRAELIVNGGAGELDRQVLDRMLPAFEHMLRNSVVHGIEMPDDRLAKGKSDSGTIKIGLRREGAEMVIVIEDDGRGIDVQAVREQAKSRGLIPSGRVLTDEEALQLILEPGFSTASAVTQHAGRGVGMDVVVTEIKKLGGALVTESTPGQGTKFIVRLPFTLAISQALIVRVGDHELYALPLPTVEGVVRLPSTEVTAHLAEETPTFNYGGQVYRFQHLGAFIGAAPSVLPENELAVPVLLIKAGEHSTALVCDELLGNREIVVKSVGPQIATIRGIAGATILGDGRVVIILDMGALARSEWRARPAADLGARGEDRRIFALVVDDSITVRRVTQRLLERNGMRVMTAKDGVDALSLLQENVPDIILLDIEMPRMDGYELATQVRGDQRLAHIPMVMITSRVSEKHRARAIEIGVNDYLGKPYQENQLLDAIEPLVAERRKSAS